MEITNFHPISVLLALLKVLERIVYDQLLSHLSSFDLLSDRQFGFRPQYSTQDVLLYVTDRWREATDKSMFTAAVFLGLLIVSTMILHYLSWLAMV